MFLGLFGAFKSITGVAKSALGSATKFKKILDFTPSLSSLVLPPQVSLGLKAASTIGGLVGIKVPSEDDLKAMAQGKVDSIFGDIRSKINPSVSNIEKVLNDTVGLPRSIKFRGKSPEEVLNSIDWLL